MPKVNFGTFLATIPTSTDQLVGFRDTSETRITISSLTALNIPLQNSLNSVYSSVVSNSGYYDSVYIVTGALSSNWNSVYSFVNSSSALNQERLNSVYTSVNLISGSWQNACTIVAFASSDWNTTAGIVYLGHNNWDEAYNIALTVENVPTDLSNLSALVVNSIQPDVDNLNASIPYWDEAYTNVYLNSSFWHGSSTVVRENSGDWESTTNIVYSNSGKWEQASIDSSNALSKYGGMVESGVITTWKTLSSQFQLDQEFVSKRYVDTIALQATVSGNFIPALYYSKAETYSQLQLDSKFDTVYFTFTSPITSLRALSGNWQSAYLTVGSNSARWSDTRSLALSTRWESAYNSINSLSGTANNVFTNVRENSANLVSVYSLVNTSSAGWESVESTTLANSANWSSAYTLLDSVTANVSSISARTLYLESNVVEINSNIVINNTTQSLYSNKILHISSDVNEITVTVTLPLPPHFCTSIVNLGTQDVLLLPNDGSVIKAANYRIYGNQFATVSLYKYKNLIYALGTVPPAS